MAIKIRTGNIISSSSLLKGSKYKYFDRSDHFKYIDTFGIDGEYVIVPSEGNLSVQYVNGKFSHHSKTYRISSNTIKIKFMEYFLKNKLYLTVANGSTVQRVNSKQWVDILKQISISVVEQKSIIEIIKQNEKLFLKYSHLVRIDTVENCKRDMKELIEIIKPFEDLINNIDKQIELIKVQLVKRYDCLKTDRTTINDLITIKSKKYEGQEEYLATNAVGEFSLDSSKYQNITKKKPSRANLTPETNSFLVSKLDGENKIMFIEKEFNYVVSTGFFNFTTEFVDHLSGFLLSDDFKKQKTLFSTGTTMVGLNKVGIEKIKLSKPVFKSSKLTNQLNKLINLRIKAENGKIKLINLLIK